VINLYEVRLFFLHDAFDVATVFQEYEQLMQEP
jgi:hypothetical protein